VGSVIWPIFPLPYPNHAPTGPLVEREIKSERRRAGPAEHIAGQVMVSQELKIDGERLWETIQSTAKWGAIPDSTGMCRLSCSDEDKAVREWFVQQTAELGCTHKVRLLLIES
jgi:hypothetical protein